MSTYGRHMGTSKIPRLDPGEYHKELASAVLNTNTWPHGFNSVVDDPNTPEDERRTYCNAFVRYVARDLFGYAEWKSWDDGFGERAADLIRTMSESARWKKLALPNGRNAYDEATLLGSQGHLIVAGALYQAPPGGDRWKASGHVCVVSPVESQHYSGSWKCKVPMVANAGGRNFIDEGMSYAFKEEPMGLWLYLG